jgi:hypothetical protein
VKSKQRLAILFGAVVALLTLLYVVPMFGATGTIRFPSTATSTTDLSWVRQDGSLILEVTDADLNTSVSNEIRILFNQTCPVGTQFNLSTGGSSSSTMATLSSTGNALSVVQAPIIDTDGNGSIDSNDFALTSTDTLKLIGANGGTGLITFQCSSEIANMTLVDLNYSSGDTDKTAASGSVTGDVYVTSDAETVATTVMLEETTKTSGKFQGTLLLTSTSSTSSPVCNTSTGCTSVMSTTYEMGQSITSTFPTNTLNIDSATYATLASMVPEGQIESGAFAVGSLKVNTADTVTYKFDDATSTGTASPVSKTITVETTAPSYANPSPAHNTNTRDNMPGLAISLTDSQSLVSKTVMKILIAIDTTNTPDGSIDDSVLVTIASSDYSAITDGYSISQNMSTIDGSEQNQDHIIYWWAVGQDAAGNIVVSDAEPTVPVTGVADACTAKTFSTEHADATADSINSITVTTSANVYGCQGYKITVDRTIPNLTGAVVGPWWDTTSVATDKTEATVTKTKSTALKLQFDGALDTTTVDATDFTVAGGTVTAAEVFAGDSDAVFLTLETALEPDAKPKVSLVGEVKDSAGNSASADSITAATDSVAPALSLNVSTTATPDSTSTGGVVRPVTNDKATVALTSNEKGTNITISVVRFGTSDGATLTRPTIYHANNASTETVLTQTGGPTVWAATADMTGDGLYNVRAAARDLNSTSNYGAAGTTSTAAVDISAATVVMFELDTGIPTPTILPSTSAGTDDPNTIISVNFSDEGKEYGLTAAGVWSNTATTVITDLDTHGTVTLEHIKHTTPAGVQTDITTSFSTADNVRFLFKASGLAIGIHKIDVKAKDVAGNKVTFTQHIFTLSQRADTEIPLTPGWNMVSLPADPSDTSVDSVIGTAPVTTVMAYDPTTAAKWLIASRDSASDTFTGTLTDMVSGHAYWVLTDTFQSIKTYIARSGVSSDDATPSIPATISLVKGWNLVPVLDLSGSLTYATGQNSSAYFCGAVACGNAASTTKVTTVYWYDTLNSRWVKLDLTDATADYADDEEHIRIGRSYWVYASDSGIITP